MLRLRSNANLEDDHKDLVLERFEEQHFQPVTIASVIDVWAHIPSEADPEYRLLRNILRSAVTNPCWHVGADEALGAAKLINSRPTTLEAVDGPSVPGALWSAACETVDDDDTRLAVAEAANVEVSSVLMSDESVVVDQTRIPRLVRQVTLSAGDLSNAAIKTVFAAWQGTDERDHYRLKWDGGVALYRRVEQAGWIYRRYDDSTTDFGAIAPALPPWRTELDLLCDATERAAAA